VRPLGNATPSWSSNISGTLGSGHVLDLIGLLSCVHHITLTATDSGGNGVQASASILIADLSKSSYLPIITRAR
jgi:hypothetical protein